MSRNYQKIGDYITVIDNRNTDGSITRLMGISIEKRYIPSVANVIGTDLTNYKIIRKGQFACSLMQVSRDQRIPLVMYSEDEPAIMSPAYVMFEVNDPDVILPEYMALWFMRAEFDREASFYAVGGVRGSLDWEDFCNMKLPVPPIPEQRKIVHYYQVIINRIELLRMINDNLEETITTVFKSYVSEKTQDELETVYKALKVINGFAFSSELFNTDMVGYPLVRIRDLSTCNPDVYTSEMQSGIEYVDAGDLLVGMDGEFVPHIWYGRKGVLNQRVCKIVPVKQGIHPMFLYCTLKPILAEIQRTQGGTTVIHIGKKDFDKMVCIHLTEDEHNSFYKKVDPLYKLLVQNLKEILNLSSLMAMILSSMSRVS